jgi:internalin A
MHKLLALISEAICLYSASTATAASPIQKPQSFARWCLQRKSVPVETRHTIDVLLKHAGTNNCQQADAQLRSLDTLELASSKIVDLKPLAGLSKLIVLALENNQIVDLKPLAGLSKLRTVNFRSNKIVDVKPLAKLSNLVILSLAGNEIVDIQPLAGLSNLTFLALESNQIVDIKPLSGLSNLDMLSLEGNSIAVKTCPIKPASICRF